MRRKNNWYVITGAPSSGKTTVLKYLEKRGYRVYYEWARIFIEQELSKGKKLKEIRRDEAKFQKKVLELKKDFEKKLNPNELIFMERGIPDTEAYFELINFPIDIKLRKLVKRSSYKKVFLMELSKFKKDFARTESKEEAYLLEKLLEKVYNRQPGVKVIRVPIMTTAKRAKFILDNL